MKNKTPSLEHLHKLVCRQQGYIGGLVSLTTATTSVLTATQKLAVQQIAEHHMEALRALMLGDDAIDGDYFLEGLEEFRTSLFETLPKT